MNIADRFQGEIVLHKMAPYSDIKSIVSLARTNKHYYQVLIESFKGLWNRVASFTSGEKELNPAFELFKFMDGCRMLSPSITLFQRNRGLFNDEASHGRSVRESLSFTNLEYEKDAARLSSSLMRQLNEAPKLEYDILRSWAMVVLRATSGFFSVSVDPFIILFSLIFNSSEHDLESFLRGCVDIRNTNRNILAISGAVGSTMGVLTLFLILSCFIVLSE